MGNDQTIYKNTTLTDIQQQPVQKAKLLTSAAICPGGSNWPQRAKTVSFPVLPPASNLNQPEKDKYTPLTKRMPYF